MKRILQALFMIIGMMIASLAQAQTPTLQWQKTIGGSLADGTGCFNCAPTIVRFTSDGGYVVAGSSSSSISGLKTDNSRGKEDYWIVKLDATKNIVWQKTFGGTDDDRLRVLETTLDDGFILGGTSNSTAGGDKTDAGFNAAAFPDMWILKLNSTGNIEWQRTLGGIYSDVPQSIVQNADSSYVIGAWSGSDTIGGNKTTHMKSFSSDYWVVKLDKKGSILWQKDYGGQAIYSTSTLTCLNKTNDGGYILGGTSYSGTGATGVGNDKTDTCRGGNDYWIVKIDGNGTKQWDKTFGGSKSDSPSSILQTSDNGYIVAGYSTSDSTGDKTENSIAKTGIDDYWIIKLNANGNMQWQNTIGGYNADYAKQVLQTVDGEYIVAGFSDSPAYADKSVSSQQTDYWLVKLDAAGKVKWDKTIIAQGNDYCTSVQQAADSSYVLIGGSYSDKQYDKTENSYGSTDFWLLNVKLSVPLAIAEIENNKNDIRVYPNPAANTISVEIKTLDHETIQNVSIIDIQGRVVVSNQTDRLLKQEMNISHLPSGIYNLRISTDKRQFVKRVSVVH